MEHQGLPRAPCERERKVPAVLVIHENRGLNPYIEDVARRLAIEDIMAFAPDGLTSLGGYPGDDEKGLALFRKVDAAKMREDFIAAAEWLKARPDCTGKLGAVGFCFGGGIVNQLAVHLGADLAAGVPFYGAQPKAEDAAKIKAPLKAVRRTRHPHHVRLARFRCGADRGTGHPRRPHLHGRQPRFPQRHHAPIRRSRSQGSLAAHAGLVRQIREGDLLELTPDVGRNRGLGSPEWRCEADANSSKGCAAAPREVWIAGRRIDDVTADPVFARPVQAIASLYDLQVSPEHRDAMTHRDEDGGEPTARRS